MGLLEKINWICKTDSLNPWIEDSLYFIEPLQSGLEGEVYKLTRPLDKVSILCKIWNKTSRPDPFEQFQLLQQLSIYDIPVSKALGCGTDYFGNPLLVTSFDGYPLDEKEGYDVTTFAKMLAAIHRIPVMELEQTMPKADKTFNHLIKYFFPMLSSHKDIKDVMEVSMSRLKPDRVSLIHGDYNLGNIVHHQGQYCIIDWTNAQISDYRYDLAWASFLIKLYNNEELYHLFRDAYFKEIPIKLEVYEYFEALAFLRWVLLSRIANIPMKDNTQKRINQYIEDHKDLLKNVIL